ncbi:MAG TPA: NHL repeat-containing protein [Gaiellaceae bacterium]|jgi:sugar lactone lactonase YvrE|nr:NHL repeat-containing protein [Gaiellaceae bacterium]
MKHARVAVVALAVAGLLVVTTAAASTSAPSGGSYKVAGTFGKVGTGNGQFSSNTNGLAVDKAGNVFVADTDNNRVQVFSAKGAFLRKWGTIGGGNGQFQVAEDIDVASDGTVAVADQQNERIQLFSSGGSYQGSFSTPSELPRGVAIGDDGTIYAAVEGSARGGIRKATRDGTAVGGLLGAGDFRPDDVELSPDGTLFYLANATQGPARIVRHITADGANLGSFPGLGSTALAVDADCNVWIANRNERRIDKRSPSGRLLATAASPDLLANDIAVGPKGDVYAIQQNGPVVRFALDKSKPSTANIPGKLKVAGGVVSVRYTASGFACPAQVAATASLSGKGVSGKASVQVAAGKTALIRIPVKAPAGATKATFTIVLKTNGRSTTEVKQVTVTR